MTAPAQYRMVHLRLHTTTVQRLRAVQHDIGAATYSEALRHLLQAWEHNTKAIQIPVADEATN